MSTATQPAKGSVRWLEDDPVTGNWWLRITTQTKTGPVVQEYEVERHKDGGYALWRIDPKTFYLISYKVHLGRHSTCDCPDSELRRHYNAPGTCKHIRGLRTALDALPF